jgi:hypothetical protein
MACWQFVILWQRSATYSEACLRFTLLPTMIPFFNDEQIRPQIAPVEALSYRVSFDLHAWPRLNKAEV